MDLNISIASEKRAKMIRITYHVLAWIGIWFIIRYYSIPGLTRDSDRVINHASVVVMAQSLFVFYFLGYVIFPRFIYPRKIIASVISILLVFQFLHIINYFEFAYLVTITDFAKAGERRYVATFWNEFLKGKSFTVCFTEFTVAYVVYAWSLLYVLPLLAIKVMRDIIRSRTRNLTLERDALQLEKTNLDLQTEGLLLQRNNLDLELRFLKSQINPHFLFNTLNAIYTRTVDVDDQAAELVLKLSDLMRYSLYESNKERVILAREISYIENYLDLERSRFSDRVTIFYHLEGNPEEYVIAPLLLVSFVENAFKHGPGKSKQSSYVDISIVLDDTTLHFVIKNNIPPHARLQSRTGSSKEQVGGFGLANTSKRLHLLYPDKHELSVQQGESEFIVDLRLELDLAPLPRGAVV